MFVFRTLRAQLLLGSLSIFVAMLALLVWNAQALMFRVLNEQFESESEQLRPLLKAAISPLLITRDYAGLNEVVKESLSGRGLVFIEVRDSRDAVVASATSTLPTRSMLPMTLALSVEGQILGQVRFGIRTDASAAAGVAMFRNSVLIGGSVLLIGAGLLVIATTRLTAGVERLSEASRRLAAGDHSVQLPDSPLTDLRQVSDAFNRMAVAVQAQMVALRDQDRFRRSVIASLTEGLLVHDEHGKITDANEAAERVLGLSREFLLSGDPARPRLRLSDAEGREIAVSERPAALALRYGQPQRDRLMQILRPDGVLLWVNINAEPIFQGGRSEPVAAVSTFTDVSARVEAERKLGLTHFV